jgi:hypothetical protein
MDISALDRSLAILESQISGVEQYVEGLEKWLWLSSLVVIIGVALEIYFVICQYKEDRQSWLRGIVRPPDRPSRWILAGEVASIILVVAGIGGELGIGILSSNANAKLRTLNNSRLDLVRQNASDAITQAGDAKTSAEGAATAARRAKELADAIAITASQARSWVLHLKPRYTSMDVNKFIESLKGVPPAKVEILYEREDEEAYTFALSIASSLGHGEGSAGWDVSEPRPVTEKDAFNNLFSRYPGSHPEYIPLVMRAGGSGGAGIIVKSIPPNPGKGAIGASALLNALANSGAPTVLNMHEEPSMPDGLIRIVIGKQFN